MDYSPWNSPGQNTGAGSYSLLQGVFPIQESNPDLPHCRQILYQLSYQGNPFIYSVQFSSVTQSCPTLCNPMDYIAHRAPLSMGFSSQEYWGGWPCLLKGIFPTQGSNPCLLHCRLILCQLSHQGNPRILAWVAYPFSRGSSWPRNQTGVSCIAGRFFTSWAIRETQPQGKPWLDIIIAY